MTDSERSALIGYWRSGATLFEISFILSISVPYIEKVITNYQKYLKLAK